MVLGLSCWGEKKGRKHEGKHDFCRGAVAAEGQSRAGEVRPLSRVLGEAVEPWATGWEVPRCFECWDVLGLWV